MPDAAMKQAPRDRIVRPAPGLSKNRARLERFAPAGRMGMQHADGRFVPAAEAAGFRPARPGVV